MDDFPDANEFVTAPHDAFFKEIFSNPEHAAGFFKKHLPAEIAARIDFQTLNLMPGSFVKPDLKQTHSDLLYSVMVAGRELMLYLLFEHQSTVEEVMRLRLFGYTHGICDRHYQLHGLPLPPVFSIVIHQGPDRWTPSKSFEDQFDLPEDLRKDFLPYLPKFDHFLLDLSKYDPATGEDDPSQMAVLQLMKMARDNQVLEFFRWLARSAAAQIGEALFAKLVYYAVHANCPLDLEELLQNLSAIPELQKRTMSLAEKLRSEGKSEGRSEGVKLGEVKGRIRLMEELLGLPPRSDSSFSIESMDEMETVYRKLRRDYEAMARGK